MFLPAMEPQWAGKMWTPLINTNVWFIPGYYYPAIFADARGANVWFLPGYNYPAIFVDARGAPIVDKNFRHGYVCAHVRCVGSCFSLVFFCN